jgi:hypothetical protein
MPFDSPDENLGGLLNSVQDGRIQLPDFQREWKWDTDRISSLLASISLDYPIGVLMMLEIGGGDVNFKPRPIAGANSGAKEPEKLLLDGQQRMTSLYQSLRSEEPVNTVDSRNKRLKRWYYVDIRKSLSPDVDREDAILAVPEDRKVRSDFGRIVEADYSTTEEECKSEVFPLGRAFDMSAVFAWQGRYLDVHPQGKEVASERWNQFFAEVLNRFVQYTIPVIVLRKETPKEAVCTVFEKVNTGGVVLNVFELLTATFAAEDFRLNDDWARRKEQLARRHLLTDLESTDFLQAVALISSYRRRQLAVGATTGEDAPLPAVSCRRKDILRMTLTDYQSAADDATAGFNWAAQFLARERIFTARDIPYRSQLVPLAALRAVLGGTIDHHACAKKVRQWFWSGVLGELYGGAIETRFARDVEQVPDWLGNGPQPRTVTEASFEASRLETLRTRNSAAYKGIHALLMRGGAQDWLKSTDIDMAAFFDLNVDIHHVFPRAWCKDQGIDQARSDSIVNKTPLSWDTNRSIGGRPPSSSLKTVQERNEHTDDEIDRLLAQHLVDAKTLRTDDFSGFYESRKNSLLALIAEALDKTVIRDDQAPEESPTYDVEVEMPDPDEELAAVLDDSVSAEGQ